VGLSPPLPAGRHLLHHEDHTMPVYELTNDNTTQTLGRVEAPTRRAALKYARSCISAREMSSREIISTVQAGKAITQIDAEGKVVDPDPDTEGDQVARAIMGIDEGAES